MKRLLVVACLTIFAVPLSAQDAAPPDFSGTWVLNISKSTLAKDSAVKSETIVISQKKLDLTFHYKTDGKKYNDSYKVDGQPHVTNDLGSSQLISKARWQGSSLIVESTLAIKIPNVTVNVSGLKPVVDTWTLAQDGRTLTNETADPKEIRVFERQ